jgi:DNA-binding GntR family transcriptional regulator
MVSETSVKKRRKKEKRSEKFQSDPYHHHHHRRRRRRHNNKTMASASSWIGPAYFAFCRLQHVYTWAFRFLLFIHIANYV